ncbi:tyrosine-type recombinase/integrase [Paenibacillus sp. Soil750]|uniref:tyrosine-type recombinase/integrase n=1 Tax=Paenibacillus sp. Soil750 TaxID=1736398 RepID=UPI001F2A2AAD|nr:tyrosine-type recombinase/integrase [Paenibacillus sp. Soil750]
MLKKRERRITVSSKAYPTYTLEQAINYVVSTKKAEGLRVNTLKDYANHWRYFCGWLINHYEIKDVGEINVDVIRNHVNYMKHDAKRYEGHKFITDDQGIGLSDTTINIRLRTLKAIFNQLEKDDIIEVSPTRNIKLIRMDEDLVEAFTPEQVKALLSQPNQKDFVGYRDYVAMVLLLDTGMRANELIGLKCDDIDLQSRLITLTGQQNKNRKPRIMPISHLSVKLLHQLVSENRKSFSSNRLFLSCFGEPLGQNQFNKRLKYYGDKAGISKKIKCTAHVFRHTMAKTYILNGGDPFSLQRILGHYDLRMTRRYIQMNSEDLLKQHSDFSPVRNIRGYSYEK